MRCKICGEVNTLYLYVNSYKDIYSLCTKCNEIAHNIENREWYNRVNTVKER